jgi:group I intron endonuclease
MNTYNDFPSKPQPGKGFVYLLCSPSGKIYIGQTTKSIRERCLHHSTTKGCTLLHSAIQKYGLGSFFVETLGEYQIDSLDTVETTAISDFCSVTPIGYNLMAGGQVRRICSPEVRKKLSEAGFKRGPPSEETRKKLSECQKGRKHSLEHIRKTAEANMGKKQSPETCKRKSEAHKGYKHTDEAKKKMSNAQKGNQKSKGKKQSQEHLRKLIESRRVTLNAKKALKFSLVNGQAELLSIFD